MSGVKAIAAGDHHSFFLKNDGYVWGVGNNEEGQLGDKSFTNRSSPVRIMSGVKALARQNGGDHSLFLKSDGSVWGTGRNHRGELGLGNYAPVNAPVKIMTGVGDMAVGSSWSFFLKTDQTLWASGANESGQFGNGTTKGSNVPIKIMTGVRSMSAGESSSLILKTDGSVLACGNRYYGKLGDGYSHDETRPVKSFRNLPQSISAFAKISNKSLSSKSFTAIAPRASSGMPVTLSVKSGPAKITGNKVTLTGTGTVVLAANQKGNDSYSKAREVTTSFKVTK
jgi:alpha-tubulin suppressor-like RCC1 family protein